MAFYLYIIQNLDGAFYKGVSQHPNTRLKQHNNNEVRSTSHKGPWTLIAVFLCESKTDALIRERKLKKYSRVKTQIYIAQYENIVHLIDS
jgi:putative endonuclease